MKTAADIQPPCSDRITKSRAHLHVTYSKYFHLRIVYMNINKKIRTVSIILLCFLGACVTAGVLFLNNRKPDLLSVQDYSSLLYSKAAKGFGEIMSSTDNDLLSVRPLSLERIYAPDHSWITALPRNRVRTIITTGDVIPARSVNYQTVVRNDFSWPFAKTKPLLSSGDLTLVNLESPLIDPCPLTNEGMIFCGDTRHGKELADAGIDIVNIANNHMGNYGPNGIAQTVSLLQKNGMSVSGTGLPSYRNIRGITFAFLGYNDIGETPQGIVPANISVVRDDIERAKKKADVIIVSFHWGIEYTRTPSDRQRELAHQTIEGGADIVIGNHPHWIESVEIYNGKLIVYAHGNFIFDQMWSDETKYGIIGKYTFLDTQLVDAEFIPIIIRDFGQPDFANGIQKTKMLELLRDISYEN